jgi:hypothetical protein
MANEAKKVELYGSNCEGDVRRYTCADANAITKGTLLVLSDPRTASGGATSGAQFAGIAAVDKEASDGSTSIGCWTNGIFELTASGACAVGHKMILAGGNKVQDADFGTAAVAASGATIVGTALETASDGEVINVRVLI